MATGQIVNKGEIYIITCTVTNKRYVGQVVSYIKCSSTIKKHGTEGRWKKHVNDALSGSNRCRAMNCYQKVWSSTFLREDLTDL